ncbi:Cyclic nucleotide-binding domain-containing protein [Marinospirillum celere]|uniref:Cyclic nucleotide-binding domain-containing protein n=1 Tax=Marinospirillum celere TaxID=1122252 RepID=A0A1I1JMU3_9GAMM|nr:cyclic nucleotide-binding domain-containing protein [Marinospirillum celere]SFC49864.1 Cyclic nucleotide-binding domain-containing protein [Marinospirillum celere]
MLTPSLFYLANLLFCLAYMVRDMAWLRAITILAATSTLPYFYFQSAPLYSAIGWQTAFIIINAINLTILLLQRRPVKLDEQEQWLQSTTLRLLKPRKMLRLLRLAKTHEIPAGEPLIHQGQKLNALLLLLSGKLSVQVEGQPRATLKPGDFVGEMSFISGQLTSADVVADEPARYLEWPADALDRLYARDSEIKDALQGALGMDMASKLARQAT